MYVRRSVSAVFLALILCLACAHAAEGPFAGVDLGVSVPGNGNYRGHVHEGATVDPFVGYMFNQNLGVQGEAHIIAQAPDADKPRNDHRTTTILGGTVGPRLSIPLLDLLELYGTAQGGVFTGLSGTVNRTAAGFAVGAGLNYNLTKQFAVGIFGRWNRAYMSAHSDLGATQVPGERGHDDIKWVTAGLGLQLNFPPAPPAPPAPPPPTPVAVPTPPVHKKIVLRAVHFDFDKSTIRSDAAPVLDEAVQILKEEGGVAVIAEGHTDAIGTVGYNLKLSLRRAEAVRNYLIAHGIDASRIRTEGFGKSQPVATNDTDEGRAQNRRVELRVR